jgi:hypothetical protein
VLVHELAHLVVPNHGPAHDAIVDRFALAERARGFLIAVDLDPDDGDDVTDFSQATSGHGGSGLRRSGRA